LPRDARAGGALDAFFEMLYQLHMAALKPAATDDEAEAVMSPPPVNVHDYVGEMAVGTWLQFDTAKGPVDARLNWVSPMRTKYIFTSRTRSQAFMVTPEELAYQLGSGTARLVVEPVPLWDRAVSAALDSLAARRPSSAPPSRIRRRAGLTMQELEFTPQANSSNCTSSSR